MTERMAAASPRSWARVAGGLYFINIVGGFFVEGYVPAALLVVGGMCYLTYSFTDFLAPGFAAQLVPYIQLPSGIAELSLCLWLLVIGVNVERWKERTSAAGVPIRTGNGKNV